MPETTPPVPVPVRIDPPTDMTQLAKELAALAGVPAPAVATTTAPTSLLVTRDQDPRQATVLLPEEPPAVQAGQVAHEIGHLAQDAAEETRAERIFRGAFWGFAAATLLAAAVGPGWLVLTLAVAGWQTHLHQQRRAEIDADVRGMRLLVAAGYPGHQWIRMAAERAPETSWRSLAAGQPTWTGRLYAIDRAA